MNMRKRKLVVMATMYYIVANAAWDRWINRIQHPTPAFFEAQKARNRAFFEGLLSDLDTGGIETQPAPAAKVFKVARVKDGVVVLETQDLGEAEEVILKAARQKKARLHLVEDDEPYVFPCEEPLDQYDPNNFVHLV